MEVAKPLVGVILAPVACSAAIPKISLYKYSDENINDGVLVGSLHPSAPEAPLNTGTEESSAMQRRKRKKANKASALSEEQLDARHPGNVRHRAVLLMLQPALAAYSRWLQLCEGCPPWIDSNRSIVCPKPGCSPGTSTTSPNQKGHNEGSKVSSRLPPCQGDEPEGDSEMNLRETPEVTNQGQDGEMSLREVPAVTNQGHGGDLPASEKEGPSTGLMDWSSLYEHRHTLKPKIRLTVAPREGMGACEGQRYTLRCFNLFGSIVANVADHAVVAEAYEGINVVLPARSRFLMSHGVGTLGPLVEVRGPGSHP